MRGERGSYPPEFVRNACFSQAGRVIPYCHTISQQPGIWIDSAWRISRRRFEAAIKTRGSRLVKVEREFHAGESSALLSEM